MEDVEQLDTTKGVKDRGKGGELQRPAKRSRLGDSRSRNLLSVFHEISCWCDRLSLPKTISDIAKQLYKRVDEEKLLRGKPHNAVIATTILTACRQAKVSRPFGQISKLTNVPAKELYQCRMVLERAFKRNPTPGSSVAARASSGAGAKTRSATSLEGMLVQHCNYHNFPPRVQTISKDIVGAARELGLTYGRSPSAIVDAAIDFARLLLGSTTVMKEIMAQGDRDEINKRNEMYCLYYENRRKLVKVEWSEWIVGGKAYIDRILAP